MIVTIVGFKLERMEANRALITRISSCDGLRLKAEAYASAFFNSALLGGKWIIYLTVKFIYKLKRRHRELFGHKKKIRSNFTPNSKKNKQ